MSAVPERVSRMALTVRPFRPDDIDLCAAVMADNSLWQRYGVTVEAARRTFAAGLERGAALFVVESDGEPGGFLWLEPVGAFARSGYIRLIGVSPTKQGRGLGRELMDHAERVLFATSDDVFLLVSDFNLAAQRFYQRRGYAQVGALPDYVLPGVTELIYCKRKPFRVA